MENYRDKIQACWVGKNVGGTLGAPYEGAPGPHSFTYYDPVPVEPLPNDDLVLQLLWLILAEENGLGLAWPHFADMWANCIKYHMDEYGIAKWNLKRGLIPPDTGLHNNWFVDGMGSAIRSEIWACLFPAKPKVAAHFARLDASVDHHGDGVWAEMFLSAAQSQAFVAKTTQEAIGAGLEVIPSDCRIAEVINFVTDLYNSKVDIADVRTKIMDKFGKLNFTDCVMNMGFIIAAMLYGENDFSKTILIAVNFGMDSDCTTATCGGFMGILLGTKAIEQKWIDPIGRDIAFPDWMAHLPLPKTDEELTDRVIALGEKLNAQLDDNFVIDISEPKCGQLPDDDHQWLLFASDGVGEPKEVQLAAEDFDAYKDKAVKFDRIEMDLQKYVKSSKMSVTLLTKLTTPVDVNGYFMVTAGSNMSVCLGDHTIMGYYGRLAQVPAIHRTEGGTSAPVDLKAGKEYLIKIRLSFYLPGMTVIAALFDQHGHYVPGFKFSV